MKELRALTREEFKRARERLLNPPPGSRIEAARKYGIDVGLLIEQLRLTPEERLRKLERAATGLERTRVAPSRSDDVEALLELECLLEALE